VKPLLLLATRPEDVAADSEYDLFLRFAGLEERDLRRFRLEQRALGRIDLRDWSGILLGGGPFNFSDPETSKSAVQRRVEADLRGLLDRVISEDFPFLGACYGIGALGSHQGGVVDRRYAEPVGAVSVSRTRCWAHCPPRSTRSPGTRRRSATSHGTPSCSPSLPAARSRRSGLAPGSTPPSSIPNWTRPA
jgi:GMP synthase (glutamine-hydrolysing)